MPSLPLPLPLLPLLLLLLQLPHSSASYRLLWEDTFDGPEVNSSNWNILSNVSEGRPPSWNQIELYTADNVFTARSALDGRSVLVLRTRPHNVSWQGVDYNITSGRVDTALKRNMTFGRLEVSARLQNDAANGIHTAHWLLGYDCWPRGGEVDLMECQSPHNAYSDSAGSWQQATSNFHIGTACGIETKHSSGKSSFPKADPGRAFNFSTDFTVFALEWNTTHLSYFVNSSLVNTVFQGMPGWSAPFSVPSWPMYLILSQAYMAKRPYGDTPEWAFPVLQEVDYVRVYEEVQGPTDAAAAGQGEGGQEEG
jgi:beta-glucanase (GH16 family)